MPTRRLFLIACLPLLTAAVFVTSSAHAADHYARCFVSGGTFQMGDNYGEGDPDEVPVHDVRIGPFWIDKYEVSNERMRAALQWAYDNSKVTATPTTVENIGTVTQLVNLAAPACGLVFTNDLFSVKAGMETLPCVQVTWYGAAAYGNYRSHMEGLEPCMNLWTWKCDFSKNGYRLPTEAEWEKAARGGLTGHHYPWDSNGGSYTQHIDGTKANYAGSGDAYQPGLTPVGYYDGNQQVTNDLGQPLPGEDMVNGYGLYDTAGNAGEWCWDWYGLTWYGEPSATMDDTSGPVNGVQRVWRGGRASQGPRFVRCANRAMASPSLAQDSIGFRTVLCTPTVVSGFISADTVWAYAQSPYHVVQSVLVRSNAVLTVEPGVQVYFDAGTGVVVTDGALVARGTEASNILFSAYSLPGNHETNRWGYVGFWDGALDASFDSGGNWTNGSGLEHVVIEFAGGVDFKGAVHASYSAPYVGNCVIRDNVQGGFYGESAQGLRLTGSTFSNNFAGGVSGMAIPGESGGAICLQSCANVWLEGNTIISNAATAEAGGIFATASPGVVFTNNVLSNNRAVTRGGGLRFYSCATAQVTGNTVVSNHCTGLGGGLRISWSTGGAVDDNVIAHCTADIGGAMNLKNMTNIIIRGNRLLSNTSTEHGGAIFVTNSIELTITQNVISNNIAGKRGAGIYGYGVPSL